MKLEKVNSKKVKNDKYESQTTESKNHRIEVKSQNPLRQFK